MNKWVVHWDSAVLTRSLCIVSMAPPSHVHAAARRWMRHKGASCVMSRGVRRGGGSCRSTTAPCYRRFPDFGRACARGRRDACVCLCVCVCSVTVCYRCTVCTSALHALSDWTLGAAAYPSKKLAMTVRRHTKVLADGEG